MQFSRQCDRYNVVCMMYLLSMFLQPVDDAINIVAHIVFAFYDNLVDGFIHIAV
jgi:hypothetical protein